MQIIFHTTNSNRRIITGQKPPSTQSTSICFSFDVLNKVKRSLCCLCKNGSPLLADESKHQTNKFHFRPRISSGKFIVVSFNSMETRIIIVGSGAYFQATFVRRKLTSCILLMGFYLIFIERFMGILRVWIRVKWNDWRRCSRDSSSAELCIIALGFPKW